MKKTLSTPRKRPAPSQRESAPDPGLDSIVELVASLRAHHQQMAVAYAPIVHDLIKRHCQDVSEIERALDRLLDIACIPAGLALFKGLCRYYYGIHPANTASYVYAYRDMWDTEADQEQEASS